MMTARPALMPVYLKRQRRASEHTTLVPSETWEEKKERYVAMVKKTGHAITESYIPGKILKSNSTFSGADMEAALTRAKFKAAVQGEEKATPDILDQVFEDFLPPTYPDEVELQTLAAVAECTSKALLPVRYQKMNRNRILDRIKELKAGIQ